MKRFTMIRFAALIIVLIFTGCGYTFQGSGSVLPDDVRTVAIPAAVNMTTFSGVGLQLSEKLTSRFERYGVVRVVEKGDDPDAELVCKIKQMTTRTRGVEGTTDTAVELELTVVVSAEFRRKNGQILYQNPAMMVMDVFAITSDVVVTSSSDFAQGGIGADTLSSLGQVEVARGQSAQAIDELLDEVARRIYLDAVAEEF